MSNSETDVCIVGGGAAGVAAARRLSDLGVEAVILEARSRLGGRAWTEAVHGVSLDLGCGWLHSADTNPWTTIARARGLTIDDSPPPWARPGAMIGMSAQDALAFGEAMGSFRDRIDMFSENEADVSAAAFLEPNGAWNPLIDAVSTYYSGAELHRVSARDLSRYDDNGVNWRVVEGYGALVAGYGDGLNVECDCEVTRIHHGSKTLRIETSRGVRRARRVIVTLPSAVLARNEDLFHPRLPAKTTAAADLPLGLADKLYMSVVDAVDLPLESRAFGRRDSVATAAYHFRPHGKPIIEAFFGGDLAAALEGEGGAAFFDFASRELTGLFGADFAKRIAPIAAHGWLSDPWARGSYSYARPGHADSRAVLAASHEDRLFFAGEACSRSDYSTAHGAYRTGVQAADAVAESLDRETR